MACLKDLYLSRG